MRFLINILVLVFISVIYADDNFIQSCMISEQNNILIDLTINMIDVVTNIFFIFFYISILFIIIANMLDFIYINSF